jgi:thioredoxin 1
MGAPGLIELTKQDFEDDRLRRDGLWLVDFGAAWCPPCRVLDKVLAPLAESYAGRLTMGAIDIDANDDVVARFGVTAAPTMLLFRDGKLLDRRVGAASKATIATWLEAAMT